MVEEDPAEETRRAAAEIPVITELQFDSLQIMMEEGRPDQRLCGKKRNSHCGGYTSWNPLPAGSENWNDHETEHGSLYARSCQDC